MWKIQKSSSFFRGQRLPSNTLRRSYFFPLIKKNSWGWHSIKKIQHNALREETVGFTGESERHGRRNSLTWIDTASIVGLSPQKIYRL